MAYPINLCSKSLMLTMHEAEKTPRPAPLPSFHHSIIVHIKLAFKSVRYYWITRPNCLVHEFIDRVDSELIRNSVSFNHRQFKNLERLRHNSIAPQIAAWPLTPEERHELSVIIVAKSSTVVRSLLPLDTERVHISFLVVENHRHTSNQDPLLPTAASALLRSVYQIYPCPRSAVTFHEDRNQFGNTCLPESILD